MESSFVISNMQIFILKMYMHAYAKNIHLCSELADFKFSVGFDEKSLIPSANWSTFFLIVKQFVVNLV